MNFTFDRRAGVIPADTVQHVQDGGSIAMLNGDILDGITLLNGSYPHVMGITGRGDGLPHARRLSRSHQVRVGVSARIGVLVTEGRSVEQGGSLAGLRPEELPRLLLKQISDDNDFGFGFSDVQSKLVYDMSSAHRAEQPRGGAVQAGSDHHLEDSTSA